MTTWGFGACHYVLGSIRFKSAGLRNSGPSYQDQMGSLKRCHDERAALDNGPSPVVPITQPCCFSFFKTRKTFTPKLNDAGLQTLLE